MPLSWHSNKVYCVERFLLWLHHLCLTCFTFTKQPCGAWLTHFYPIVLSECAVGHLHHGWTQNSRIYVTRRDSLRWYNYVLEISRWSDILDPSNQSDAFKIQGRGVWILGDYYYMPGSRPQKTGLINNLLSHPAAASSSTAEMFMDCILAKIISVSDDTSSSALPFPSWNAAIWTSNVSLW